MSSATFGNVGRLTREGLLAQQVGQVLHGELVWGSEVFNGRLVGGQRDHHQVVHGEEIVLVPSLAKNGKREREGERERESCLVTFKDILQQPE